MTNPVPEVRDVAKNIYLIDSESAFLPKMFCSYLINEDKKTLIEVGSPAAVPTLLKGLDQIGVNPKDIEYIVMTHIHLDHAGGVGLLLREASQAKVITHPKGAKHLIDPSKLVSSSVQAQKGSPNESLRYDLTMPVAPEKILMVEDNQTLSLGSKQKIKFIYTPGHTPHHISIYEERNNGLFVGEASGYLLGNKIVPNTPPPTDLDASFASLKKLIALSASALYCPHWGVHYGANEILKLAQNRMMSWYDIVGSAVANSSAPVIEQLKDFIGTETKSIEETPGYNSVARSMVLLSLKGCISYFETRMAQTKRKAL
jgi:glyoxylase-like metal-dependent hydrolase (beta-lactamase superfamily II)